MNTYIYMMLMTNTTFIWALKKHNSDSVSCRITVHGSSSNLSLKPDIGASLGKLIWVNKQTHMWT
jgi:hypothetical protein